MPDADGLNKFQRRAKRLRAEGRCDHCGRPCAPYFNCPERRAYKMWSYLKRRNGGIRQNRRVKIPCSLTDKRVRVDPLEFIPKSTNKEFLEWQKKK